MGNSLQAVGYSLSNTIYIPSLPESTLVEGATSKRSGGFFELDLDVGLGHPVIKISCYRERERERYPVRGIH